MKRLTKWIAIFTMFLIVLIIQLPLALLWLLGADEPYKKFYDFAQKTVPL